MPTTRRTVLPERAGFTLLELLVVISIIALLTAILIPVVGKVRTAARTASTQALISQLSGACDRYYSDFHSYPGPFNNDQIYDGGALGNTGATFGSVKTLPPPPVNPNPPGFDVSTPPAFAQMSMSENLVLGLMGGLVVSGPTGGPYTLNYDPSQIGNGPMSLNVNQPKRYAPYIDATTDLSWNNNTNGKTGHFMDDAGAANDTAIPEFIDRYADPLPILYMRAKVGYTTATASTAFTATDNSVITNNPDPTMAARSQYDLSQIISYTGAYTGSWPFGADTGAVPPTGSSIGVGKSIRISALYYQGAQVFSTPPPTPPPLYHGLRTVAPGASGEKAPTNASLKYQYPYDCFPYFLNDISTYSPRGKDSYILISAGPDRIYGTDDDLTTFGSVAPVQ